MRKVKFVTHGHFGGQNSMAPGPVKEGWFHGFFQEGNNEGGIDPVAVIETLIGECVSVGVKQVKFESQPAESQGVGHALHTTGDKSGPSDITPVDSTNVWNDTDVRNANMNEGY